MSNRTLQALFLLGFVAFSTHAQNKKGVLSGGFQSESQYYVDDELINTTSPSEKIGSNNYFKLDYVYGDFSVGVRYEAYMPPMLGYPVVLEGEGIVNRYASYKNDFLKLTVGNFYEQFGSGLTLRAYEERLLGIDNSIDGINVKLMPVDGIELTFLAGQQRLGFETGAGTVRGVDGIFRLNDIMQWEGNLGISLGGSLVSKYQLYTGPVDEIKEDVNSYSGRFALDHSLFNFSAEFVEKDIDPQNTNGYNTRGKGRALLGTFSTVQKGIGFSWTFRTIENMDFRSDRDASLTNLWINYIPAETRQHGYLLPNIYPYAVQLNGEIGNQFNLNYTFAKESLLGGKYGTGIALNYAKFNKIDRSAPVEEGEAFTGNFLRASDTTLYRDFNVEITKKLSKRVKIILDYVALNYNRQEIEGVPSDNVISHIGVLELQYRLKKRKSLRVELQHLSTEQDLGNWAGFVTEYSMAPHWSFFVADQYNYGGEDKVHYFQGGFSYSNRATRIALNYGRQRGGLICVGGVCRFVPAATGFTLSMSTSFTK